MPVIDGKIFKTLYVDRGPTKYKTLTVDKGPTKYRLINARAGYSFSDIFSSVITGAKVRLVTPNLNSDGDDWVHHVAFFIEWPSDHYSYGIRRATFKAIGGNQSYRVCFDNFYVFDNAPAETDNLPYTGYTPVEGLYFKKRVNEKHDDYFANTNPPY